MKQDGIRRETNHKRLNLIKQIEGCRVRGGQGERGGVMDIGEGMCYGECCEVCKPGDSQTCTHGTNNTLYVNNNLKIMK